MFDPGLTPDTKPIIDVLDADAFLPLDVVKLAAWVADYYACGVGEAIATAMPPRAWIESERHARITDAGEARMLGERGARRDVLELLSGGRVMSVGSLVWVPMATVCPSSCVTTERAACCLVADGTAAVSALGVQRASVVGSATVGSSMHPSLFTSSALSC